MSDSLAKADASQILDQIDENVSPEERTEILEKINSAVQESRIAYGPEHWRLDRASSGLGMTVALNVLVIAVTLGGLWSVWTFFQPTREDGAVQEVRIQTAEARLLEELKREASLALGEKDREIAEIQQRLSSIERERQSLITDTEAKIRAKEAELEQRLQAELERERQRLLSQGLGQAEIERRIQALAERRRREIEAELQAFRIQAETERRRLERALDEAQQNYRATLNAAAVERQKILEDVSRREQEIQLRAQSVSNQLQQAQSELAQLRARAEQIEALDNQIAGLIARARDQFGRGQWSELKDTSEAIAEVARQPAYEADAQTLARRQGHLLLSQALTSIAESRLSQQKAAQSEDGAGSVAQALALQRSWIEAESLLRSAEADWRSERYEAALDKSLRAVNLLQINPGREEFFRRWVQLGATRALEEKTKSDTQQAQPLYVQATAVRGLDPQRARSLLLGLLSNYPLAEQRRDALTLLQQIIEDSERASAARIRDLERLVGEAQDSASTADLSQELSRLRAENTQLQGQNEGLRRQITSLEQQLAVAREQQNRTATPPAAGNLQEENAQLRSRVTSLESDLRQTREQLAQSREELQRTQQERQQDAPLAQRMRSLRESYASFSQGYGALSAGQELERQQLLNTFLLQVSTPDVFPDFKSRVDASIAAARNAGQKESLFYAADVLEGSTVLSTADSRRTYFNSLRTRYRNDPGMLDFLATLERYLNTVQGAP